LLVSFGGPEGPNDVLPFLENVLRGKNVPEVRKMEVAEHYFHFHGLSPINQQNRELIRALKLLLSQKGPELRIYWGNRNWHPYLPATVGQMAHEGVKSALAFVTSAYSSYSGCGQYLEDIEKARAEVGSTAPRIDKLRVFYNHPGFIEPHAEGVCAAFRQIPKARRRSAALLFTAHSLPVSMADNCAYEDQLAESCRLVARAAGQESWQLAYQSRSGPPHQPWLEPNIIECLEQLKNDGATDVVVSPIGFISDHLEVLYDLDLEAKQKCDQLGLAMIRAATPGTHPQFVEMIRELTLERIQRNPVRKFLGSHGPGHDVCPRDCCGR
jgi:ferrochelatase